MRTQRITVRTPLRLVEDPVRRDVVDALRKLLEAADGGFVTGVAYAATMRGGQFISSVVGHCRDNPTHARGAVSFLQDQIAGIQHRMDPMERR